MKNMLLTKEQEEREFFESFKFNLNDVKFFLTYYMQLLEAGFLANFISEEERNCISELIFSALMKEVEDEENYIVINNWLYVTSLYLQSMSSWNAWKQVSSITNCKSASNFVNSARNWFLTQLTEINKMLAETYEEIISLDNIVIKNTYETLEEEIINLKAFANSKTQVDLRTFHSYSKEISFYTLINSVKEENYLSKLEKTVEAFKIEIQIMSKMNAKNFFKGKKEECKAVKKGSEDMFEKLEKEMKEQINNLHQLEREKIKKVNGVDTENEVAKIKDYYKRKEIEILETWSAREKEMEEKDFFDEGFMCEGNSLSDLIKEYALYSMAQRGKRNYPQNLKEKEKRLLEITNKKAIPYLLEGNFKLTEEESNYLKKGM